MGTLLEKVNLLEKVSELIPRGINKPHDIARELEISPFQAKALIKEYRDAIAQRVMEDPEFLDRLQENTLEALEHMDMLIRETWGTYDTAKDNDMIPQQLAALKLGGDLAEKRAKLLQLMGAKVDSGFMAQMQRAQQVNEILSRILKEVVAHCDVCKLETQVRLARAFQIMNKPEEAADMEHVDYIEADIIEEDIEYDTTAMMADVISAE